MGGLEEIEKVDLVVTDRLGTKDHSQVYYLGDRVMVNDKW